MASPTNAVPPVALVMLMPLRPSALVFDVNDALSMPMRQRGREKDQPAKYREVHDVKVIHRW